MWSLQILLVTLYIALRCVTSVLGVIHVTGYVEREVKVSCPYPHGYESYEKYLCKNDCGGDDVLITTSQSRSNKYAIYDDKRGRNFTVTISDLYSIDAGKYWCGVSRTGKDIYTEVKLKVVQDRCCDTVTKIQSYEGYSESITCPYEPQYQNNLKYICRGNRPSTCLQQALITSDIKPNGRFRLNDDKVSTNFRVTISSLSKNDSGSYLCGVQRNSDLDVFSAIQLEIEEWCCVKSNEISGTVGHPIILQCPYPPQHWNNRKFLCKGEHPSNCTDVMIQSRFTLQDDSSSSFLVKITELEASDAGTYWCGSDSQWRVGNYIKIQLSVVFLKHTSTVTPPTTTTTTTTVETPETNLTYIPTKSSKDQILIVVYAVPPVLVLICAIVVIVYKCKHKIKDEVTMNRITFKAEDADEVIEEAQNDIYGNQDVVINSNKQPACNYYCDSGDDEPDYENFTTEEIYCNENFHNASRR